MKRLLPAFVFVSVFAIHAQLVRQSLAASLAGWSDAALDDRWGFHEYLAGHEYYMGFSYALSAAFVAWNLQRLAQRRKAAVAGGASSITGMGLLMAGGCFLVGCCGSPMLGVYLGLFGSRALGAGKPLMALVTLLSVTAAWWWMSRQHADAGCATGSCDARTSRRPD